MAAVLGNLETDAGDGPLIKFDHGAVRHEHSDGQGRWARCGYVRNAQVVSAEIDLDHTIQIDRNNFNNSFTVKPNRGATYKVSNYMLFLTQLLGQVLAWWGV